MGDRSKAVWDWSGGAKLPPSTMRVDPRGWLALSAALGAVAGAAALSVAWTDLPWMPLPRGTLWEHATHWAAVGAHAVAAPLFERQAAIYAAFWESLSTGERAGILARVAVGLAASAVPAWLLARPMLAPRDGYIHVRGPRRFVGRDATRILAAEMRPRLARGRDHEIAPKLAYPAEMWTRGTLIVGGVGSGKSTALRPLIDQIVKAGEQMMLFDAKSEFTSGWAEPKLIAPWDSRSLAWDIAKDLEGKLEMERFAETMIQDSSDPVWANASRQVLVGVLLSLRGDFGVDWGWGELRERLSLPHSSLLSLMETWHKVAARSLEKASVTSQGVLINLAAYCSAIFHLADAWGGHPKSKRISIVEWTMGRSPHKQLILQGQENYGSFPRVVAEGIVGVFSALVASVDMPDDPRRKIWFVCDEAARLGKVPMLPLFSMGRSRGVRPVVAAQDLSQLEEIHGAPAIKSLVSMVGTLIVGQTMQGETAEMMCKAFGTREVERPCYPSHSSAAASGGAAPAVTYAREEVALYKPSELASRLGFAKDGKSVALILFTGGDAYELDWPIFQMRAVRTASVKAQWTKGYVPTLLKPAQTTAAAAGEAPILPFIPAPSASVRPADDETVQDQADPEIGRPASSISLAEAEWLINGVGGAPGPSAQVAVALPASVNEPIEQNSAPEAANAPTRQQSPQM